MSTVLDALHKSRLFGSLPDETLADIAPRFEVSRLAQGAPVFREGDEGLALVLVVDGRLRSSKRRASGDEVTLSRLVQADVAGLTSLLTGKAHSATLIADVPTEVALLARDDLDALRASHAEIERALLAHLAEKVRARSADLVNARAPAQGGLRVAVFDSKDYVRTSFHAVANDLDLHYFDVRLGVDTAPLAAGAPVICAFVNDVLDAPTLEALARGGTELVAMRCAGYNNVDVAAAAKLGLSVVRVPAYSPYAVAEHAAALVLCLNRKLHVAHTRVRDGNFSLHGLVGFDMHGRTAGIVGAGTIGKCLARILNGFGMRVLAWDVHRDPDFAREIGMTYVELDALFRESDVVSLHVPLVAETRHLVGADALARMKPGAMLVNTSRGGLVDTPALIEALKSGRLGSAALDVYEEESAYFFEDHSTAGIADDVLARLLTFPNVLVTSHQAFLTIEALAGIATTTFANIAEWRAGRRGPQLTNAVTTGR